MITTLYTDGGVVQRNPSSIGGTWAVIAAQDDGTVAWEESGLIACMGGDPITNNQTELIAIIEALERVPKGWSGLVRSDSLVSIRRARDPKRAKMNGISYSLHERLVAAVMRAGEVEYELLSGHPTKKQLESGIGPRGYPCHILNVRCDYLCGLQAKKALKTVGNG